MSGTTSLTLLERLRSPDLSNRGQSWARFVHIYTPLLMHWAARQGFQESDAADVTQEALLKLLAVLPTQEREAGKSFRGWLMTLLRNVGLDYRRRKASRAIAGNFPDEFEPSAPEEIHDLEESEYRQWVIRRGMDLVRDDFSESTWKAFEGVMIDGSPAATVAAELGIAVNAVYLARHRVLARLRQELGDLLE